MSDTEDAVERQWLAVRFTEQQIATFSQRARDDLHRSAESGARLIADQRRRLTQLERQKQKLIDAYMADALPVDALKERQTRVAAEIADAKRLIQNAQTASTEVFNRLEQVLSLLTHAEQLYNTCGPAARQILNSAVFQVFHVDSTEPGPASGPAVAQAPLTPAVAAVIAPSSASASGNNAKTLSMVTHAEGSNVDQLAEATGFEPARVLPRPLSRRLP